MRHPLPWYGSTVSIAGAYANGQPGISEPCLPNPREFKAVLLSRQTAGYNHLQTEFALLNPFP